jgi:hypothetical protein
MPGLCTAIITKRITVPIATPPQPSAIYCLHCGAGCLRMPSALSPPGRSALGQAHADAFSQNAEMLPCRTRQRRVLGRHANEYKSRSRRDDDGGGGGGDGGGDDASNAVGQRGNSDDDDDDDDDGGGGTARPVRRLASLTRRCARHLSSTHSVHRESAPGDRDNWSVGCFV